MDKNKRKVGALYEEKAVEYLCQHVYSILERNYRNRSGEIDIIAKCGEYICFTEVKYRTTERYGSPLEAVDVRKQKQLRQVARYYLMCHGLGDDTACRFDVIAFSGEEIVHVENAF